MVQVTRTFVVNQPVRTVMAYLADLGHAAQWDPGIKSCDRLDSGPVSVGSTWRSVSTLLGRETEVTYRLDRLDPGHIVFLGENSSAISTDDITVRAIDDTGSEITYDVTVDLHGMAKLAAPLLKPEMEKSADGSVNGIIREVAGL